MHEKTFPRPRSAPALGRAAGSMAAIAASIAAFAASTAAFAALTASIAAPALAATPADLLAGYEQAARKTAASFAGSSAERGRQFFVSTHGTDWSCATCHTADPSAPGKHAKTGKRIAPLAPAAAADRFTEAAKAEKWFKRNCNDVLGRECTAAEKGDVLAYLLSVQR